MPVIWPRASFTLIEPEIGTAMDQAGIGFEDAIQGEQHVAAKLLESARQNIPGSRLQQLRDEIQSKFEEVRPALAATEASLGPALDTAQRKILQNIESLRSRFIRREAQSDHSLTLSADGIVNSCRPNGVLQERELGVFPFLARHGAGLFDTIASHLDLSEFSHRIIRL
jgi:bacillithiol synthase